ncbi:MAG: coproporphyrinogen III oxidase, partial [Candidatus Omnitrophica bacterium]|nr:coproporphyrinogen III oxidase [Candidatus Omnitrophota bacterium]
MLPKGFPLETFLKYSGLALPRHVSYPMPTAWSDKDGEDYVQKLSETDPNNPLSIYLHIPFCETLCTFCGCNTFITRNHGNELTYSKAIQREWALYLQQLPQLGRAPVKQIHLGGGTPTFFSADSLKALLQPLLDAVVI